MIVPNLREEKRLWKSGVRLLAGVDEVGRGALAGPVVAAAVLLRQPQLFLKDPALKTLKIRDSKRLEAGQREYIYSVIRRHPAIEIQVASVSPKVIDSLNIRQATILAMTRAVEKLGIKPQALLIDGIETLPLHLRQITYVKGDRRILLISLASICAKVSRDRLMRRLAQRYPGWGFDIHKGYGTKLHRRRIRKHGISNIHRKTFT